MDKKKRIKTVSAVCFVLICGAVCVWIHCGQQGKEQIVWEQNDRMWGNEEDVVTGETKQSENKDSAEGAEIEENVLESAADSVEKESEMWTERQKVIYVHICGAVAAEGVYTLSEGSRLIDGVTAAGGFLPVADTSYHNLAALLSDGQKVYVPTEEETKEVPVSERTEPVGNVGAKNAEGTENTAQQAKVNLNTAGIEELTTLSGIGESKAKSILQYREKVGAFQKIEELKKVSGIGEAMFERVKDQITVE